MPIDQQDLFCTALAITGDTNASNIIDYGSASTRQGTGPRPLYVQVHVTEAFTDSGNNSTAEVRLVCAPDVALTNTFTNTTLATIPTNAAIGKMAPVLLPGAGLNCQYASLVFVVSGGNFTTGKVTAYVTADPDDWSAKSKAWTGPTF